jgi:hypothetical protein
MRSSAIAVASLLLGSCNGPAIEPSQSLVTDKALPPASELRREIIGFYYDRDRSLTRQLSYELKPNDVWSVVIVDTRTYAEINRSNFQLPKGKANQARSALWRLRPEKLDGVQWPHMPADCPPQPTDTHDDVAVGFTREGPKPGVEDDQVGVFTLPNIAYCKTPKSLTARELIANLMRQMPGHELREEYAYWPPMP